MAKKISMSKLVVGLSSIIFSAILLLIFQNCNSKLQSNLYGSATFSSISPIGVISSSSSAEELAKFGIARKNYADNSNDAYLMDGMLLSANQFDNLMGVSKKISAKAFSQKTMAHLSDPNIIWPNGVLKFKFDSRTLAALRSRGLSDGQIGERGNQIVTACLKWAEVSRLTCLYLSPSEAADTTNTVWITPETYVDNSGQTRGWCADAGSNIGTNYISCASIGRNRIELSTNSTTGQQNVIRRYGYITIVEDHWDNQNIIVHEVGHLLGLQHEYQRDDRDGYILKIDPSNPIPAPVAYNPGRPFDYGSIMLQQVTFKDSDEYKGSRAGIAFTIPLEKVNPEVRQLRQRPAISSSQLTAGKDHYTAAELNSSPVYRAQFYPSPSDALDAEGIYPFGADYIRKSECTVDGVVFPHGTTMGFFKTLNPMGPGRVCDYEFRVCNDGVATGSAQFSTCDIKCNLAGGIKVNLGDRTVVFPVNTVPAGSTCPVGTEFTCDLANSGTLQEIVRYQTCNVQQSANPLAWDSTPFMPPTSLTGKVADTAVLKDIKVKNGKAPYTFKVKTNTAYNGTYYVSLANGTSDLISQTNSSGSAQLRFRFPAILATQQFEIEVIDADGVSLKAFVGFSVTPAPPPLAWLITLPNSISGVVNAPATTHDIRATNGTGPYTYTITSSGLTGYISFVSVTGQDVASVTTAGIAQLRIRYNSILTSRTVTIEARDSIGSSIQVNFPLEITAAAPLPLTYDNSVSLNTHAGTVGDAAVDFNFKVKNGVPPYTFKMLSTDSVSLQFASLVGALGNTVTNSTGLAVIRIGHPSEISNKTIQFEAKDSTNATLNYSIALTVTAATETGGNGLTWKVQPPAMTEIIQGRIGDPMRSLDIQIQGGTPPYRYHMATRFAGDSGDVPHMTLGLTTNEKVWTLNNVSASSVVKLQVQFLAVVNDTPFQLEVTDSSIPVKSLTANVLLNVRPTVDTFGWESGSLTDLNSSTGSVSQFRPLKVSGGRPPYRFRVWNPFAGFPSGKQYVDFATTDNAPGETILNSTAEATVRTRFLEVLPIRNFTIQAFDADNTMISKSFNLTVNPVAVPLVWVGAEPQDSYSLTDADPVFHQRIEVSGGTDFGATFKIDNGLRIGTTGKYFVSIVPDPARFDDVQEFTSTQKFAYIRIRPSQVLANTNFTLTVTNGVDPNKAAVSKTFSVSISSSAMKWGEKPISVTAVEGDGDFNVPVSVLLGRTLFSYAVNATIPSNLKGNRFVGFASRSDTTGLTNNLTTNDRETFLRIRAEDGGGTLSETSVPILITDNVTKGTGTTITETIQVQIKPRFTCTVTNSSKTSFTVNGSIQVNKQHQGQYGHYFIAVLHSSKWYTRELVNGVPTWKQVGTEFNSIGGAVFGSTPATGGFLNENLSLFPGGEMHIGYGIGGDANHPGPAFLEMATTGRYFKCGTISN